MAMMLSYLLGSVLSHPLHERIGHAGSSHGLPSLTSTLSLLKKPSGLASSASSHGQLVSGASNVLPIHVEAPEAFMLMSAIFLP
jgi:hypothetical protein